MIVGFTNIELNGNLRKMLQITTVIKFVLCSHPAHLQHYLHLHPLVEWTWQQVIGKKRKENIKQTWIKPLHLLIFSMQSCFLSSTSEHNQPQSRLVRLVLCMHPSCLFCSYLLMGFLFCITRANLIRAEGIQISVHPPNAIWSPNKGLGERKERITNVFSRAGKRIAWGMWIF